MLPSEQPETLVIKILTQTNQTKYFPTSSPRQHPPWVPHPIHVFDLNRRGHVPFTLWGSLPTMGHQCSSLHSPAY